MQDAAQARPAGARRAGGRSGRRTVAVSVDPLCMRSWPPLALQPAACCPGYVSRGEDGAASSRDVAPLAAVACGRRGHDLGARLDAAWDEGGVKPYRKNMSSRPVEMTPEF